VSTTAETVEVDPQPTVLAALPTVSTVQVLGPVSPLPSNVVVNPDLDEHCTRLYEVMTGMSLGRYVPVIAKPLKFDIGTGEKVGCEMYFAEFAIAWVDAARDRFQPTEDADETQLMMSSGNVGFFDPTGNDGDGFGGVGIICMPQPDGTVVQVSGFEIADLDVTLTIADGFDQSLADSRG